MRRIEGCRNTGVDELIQRVQSLPTASFNDNQNLPGTAVVAHHSNNVDVNIEPQREPRTCFRAYRRFPPDAIEFERIRTKFLETHPTDPKPNPQGASSQHRRMGLTVTDIRRLRIRNSSPSLSHNYNRVAAAQDRPFSCRPDRLMNVLYYLNERAEVDVDEYNKIRDDNRDVDNSPHLWNAFKY